MKLKVFFLKKKHIYAAIAILIILILLIILLCFNSKNTISTFNIISNDKLFKTDLTGDGEEDILYIKTDKDKYYIQVNTKDNKNIFIEPNKKLNTVGTYIKHWPMRLTLKDISRDNIPEIFIQSSQKNKPIQHVFLWENDSFKDILCNYNNILGFTDYSNSRTPKIISGNFQNHKISFTHYILIKDTLKPFTYSYNETYMGKDSITNFINFIEELSLNNKPDFKLLNNIVCSNLQTQSYDVISKLSNETTKLVFQDATFKDSKYNKHGEISRIDWTLSFRGMLKDTSQPKNYTFNLVLKPCKNSKDKFYFKISSITLTVLK